MCQLRQKKAVLVRMANCLFLYELWSTCWQVLSDVFYLSDTKTVLGMETNWIAEVMMTKPRPNFPKSTVLSPD